MSDIAVICSMLHEAPGVNSATRLFRAQPVLNWTLRRLAAADQLSAVGVLCWEDQLQAVAPIAGEAEAHVLAKGPRRVLAEMEAITAARRWSDGWRSGLLGTCAFDLGFHAPWALELAERLEADAVILVDPASGLVDPQLLHALVDHAEDHPDVDFYFQPAAPGLTGPLVRLAMLRRLVEARTHPGRVLHYRPDQLSREMLGGSSNAPTPAAVARSPHRFTLDSDRQIARISAATVNLNGQLLTSAAEELVARMQAAQVPPAIDPLPREVVLEVNTDRRSRPIFSPLARGPIPRPCLTIPQASALFRELADCDDTRLTLAGVGDPLLHEEIFAILESAHSLAAGRVAIHLESDFLTEDPHVMANLASAPVDVISVLIPALTAGMYGQVMEFDGYSRVLENVRLFLTARSGRTPILAPTFIKCRQNLGEMEAWYDQWLAAVGTAVIRGPSDFCGLIDDVAVADMAPPKRGACGRLSSRISILSDGRIVACEQDALGQQPIGTIGVDSLASAWQRSLEPLRSAHYAGQWAAHPLCAACKEWHRP